MILDLPRNCSSVPFPKSQLVYKLTALNRGREEKYTTTYFFAKGQDPRAIIARYRHVAETRPKLLSRLVFTLYSQLFELAGSIKSAIAFLHDHMDLLPVIRRFTLRYRFKPAIVECPTISEPVTVPRCDLWDFRRFSNIPVHKMSGLEYYKLLVEADFWDYVNWETRSAASIFEERDVGEDCAYVDVFSRHPNFLNHFARLCNSVCSTLAIEGCTSDEQKTWSRDLDTVMRMYRSHRRDWVTLRACCCDKEAHESNLLEHCCLWVLPPREQKNGVPPPLKQKKARERYFDVVHKQAKDLRLKLREPLMGIAVGFVRGAHFRAYVDNVRQIWVGEQDGSRYPELQSEILLV